jgi:hypothetical protein
MYANKKKNVELIGYFIIRFNVLEHNYLSNVLEMLRKISSVYWDKEKLLLDHFFPFAPSNSV